MEDGDVGVSIFPESKEILIRLAGGFLVAHHRLGPPELQVRKSTKDEISYNSPVVEHFLEFRCSLLPLARFEVRLPTNVYGVQIPIEHDAFRCCLLYTSD